MKMPNRHKPHCPQIGRYASKNDDSIYPSGPNRKAVSNVLLL